MAVITDPDLLKILKKESEDRIYHIYNKIMTTEYPTDPRFLDLSGKDFRYIHVDKYCGKDKYGVKYFHCTCNYCGFPTIMTPAALNTKSEVKTCGCYKYHHGDTYDRLNKIYFGMIHRCYNTKSTEYHKYGGRGIKVCDEWLGPDGYHNFKNFAISTGYNEDLTLDRIDNDGNYCPENCRWTTVKVQSNNRSTTHYLLYDNHVFSIKIWSEIVHLPISTFRNRLERGWSIEEALRTPPGAWFSRGENLIDIVIPDEYLIYDKYEEFKAKGILDTCIF